MWGLYTLARLAKLPLYNILSTMTDDKNKRIYVREKAHKRYKSWAARNGYSMLEALDMLMDIVEAGKQKQNKTGGAGS